MTQDNRPSKKALALLLFFHVQREEGKQTFIERGAAILQKKRPY